MLNYVCDVVALATYTEKKKQNNFPHIQYKCAADFSLLNLPKGKSLGRSKPATNS